MAVAAAAGLNGLQADQDSITAGTSELLMKMQRCPSQDAQHGVVHGTATAEIHVWCCRSSCHSWDRSMHKQWQLSKRA